MRSDIANKIVVGLDDRSYEIIFGSGVFTSLPEFLENIRFSKRLVVITNPTVMAYHGERLMQVFSSVNQHPLIITIPDGEEYKTLSTLTSIYDQLMAAGIDRSSGVLAFGGGVVGDVAGFAAATYMRGIPCVQVPTTLLSQVDSSVGGKTAVNHAQGKNIIGAFSQPRLVCIDVDFLRTLPEREYRAGIAEVVKYGVIRNYPFFEWLEENVEALNLRDTSALLHAIKTSCQTKADIVEIDEKEGSLRAILNYGHTFGHAVETLTGYKSYLHGEAVSIGMVVAAKVAAQEMLCSADDVNRIAALLCRFGLPTTPPDFSVREYVASMMHDKKVSQGMLRMVLNRGIGDCLVQEIHNLEAQLFRMSGG
ncbi:3-dehydroquinate synthase [Malonomonas rubra]|uniref:3-dehydroquinate synthase n=1 Tax=Malonomonas rubra TaxID=57040 RepID=UPI0026F209D4|nr:3-dehydroquinate synthase [Malonomonas rubra]